MNFMNVIYEILGYPLGWVMWLLYKVVPYYGITLFIFTVLTRLAMFPLTLKQQKTTAKMSAIQPKIAQVQNRFKNDKEKMNAELMKLYQEEGYNPMAGCTPMLIQFPLLFGLIDVIYKPLYHILRLPKEVIVQAETIWAQVTGEAVRGGLSIGQLNIIRTVKENPAPFMELGQDVVERIQGLNFSFLGMDLAQIPSLSMFQEIFTNFNPVLFIPILSGLSALVSSIQMTRSSAQSQPVNPSMKGMMYMMPVLSTWIAFSVPAGVGLYWFYSNVIALVQNVVVNKVYNPREMAEKAKRETEEQLERERQERIEARKKLKEQKEQTEQTEPTEKKQAKQPKEKKEAAIPEADAATLTAKEANRRKLAEARKRDAEKYGEEYVDVTDDDLR